MDNAAEVRVDADILDAFTRYVYEHGVKEQNGIEAGMWSEVLRVINDATVEGLVQSQVPTLEENFLRELRHGNEVFAAFKVHTMGSEMQRQLIGPDGKLKPFSQWRDDVQKIASHQCGAWLKTEYDTAVIRAHNAADWQEYERDKDIMPNLRWMPTTSKEPETKHRSYWLRRVNLPVDDPWWNEHHPGDRWNCKCSLEQNDDPVVPPPSDGSDSDATPHRGLENNPGMDGHIFNDTHPYFPKSCSECFANKGGSLKNRLKLLFRNQEKDCFHCPYIDGCTDRTEAKKPIEEAANKKKKEIIEKNLMPAKGKITANNLLTGRISLSGKARHKLLQHAHHDYDVEAAQYAWNNIDKLHSPRQCELGEGKDKNDPVAIANIERKKKRSVCEYIEYKIEYKNRIFLIKTEHYDYGLEKFYAINYFVNNTTKEWIFLKKNRILAVLSLTFLVVMLLGVFSSSYAASSGFNTASKSFDAGEKSAKGGLHYSSKDGTRYAIRINGQDISGVRPAHSYWVYYRGSKYWIGEGITYNTNLFTANNSPYRSNLNIDWKPKSGSANTSNFGLSQGNVTCLINAIKKEAEANKEEDAKKKDLADAKNDAEQVVFMTEKAIKDLGDKVSEDDKKEAEKLIEKVNKAIEKEDVDKIKEAKDKLLTKANEFASKVYEEAAKANTNTEENETQEEETTDKKNDDVVDADYEEK